MNYLQQEPDAVSNYPLLRFVLKMELVYELPQSFLCLFRDCHAHVGDLFGCDFGVTMSEEEHYDNFADDVEEHEMVELFASVRQQFEFGVNYFALKHHFRHCQYYSRSRDSNSFHCGIRIRH